MKNKAPLIDFKHPTKSLNYFLFTLFLHRNKHWNTDRCRNPKRRCAFFNCASPLNFDTRFCVHSNSSVCARLQFFPSHNKVCSLEVRRLRNKLQMLDPINPPPQIKFIFFHICIRNKVYWRLSFDIASGTYAHDVSTDWLHTGIYPNQVDRAYEEYATQIEYTSGFCNWTCCTLNGCETPIILFTCIEMEALAHIIVQIFSAQVRSNSKLMAIFEDCRNSIHE